MRLIKSYALLSILLASYTAPLMGVEIFDERKVGHVEIVVDCEDGQQFDSAPILSRLKTQEGDDFSQLTFDSDLKSLADEYDRVEPTLQLQNGKVYITIHVVPKPLIHQIVWSGNVQCTTSALQKELDIQPNTVFNRQEFNKAFNKVKEFYFKKGYFESQLCYSIQPIAGSNQIDIFIDVQEGRPGHIRKIVLNGFTKSEESDIEEQMYLKKYNFLLSWITGTGIYRDEALEQDKMTIINYLHNKGYADARVQIHLQEDPASGKLIIEITAERGPIYSFGTVTFTGNTLFTDEEIARRSMVKEGETFSPEKERDTAQAIKELYGQKGYIDTSVQYETLLREDEPVFDVRYYIEEGEQYKVGLIHIFGNSSTNSNVILRESLLVPGETFDSRKLKATQQRLEAIGYFKSVNVYAVRTADDECLGETYRDVYIEVEETTTGNVSLFMGFSSMDDVFGGLDLTERNFNLRGLGRALGGQISALRGGGEFFHVRGTVGKKQNNILISWMNPYVNDSLWRLGVELSRTFSELQKHMVVVTYGGSVYANYPLTSYWTAGMRQRLRHSKDDLHLEAKGTTTAALDSVTLAKRALDQHGLISAFSGNLSYDSTDNAFKPHRGWRSYLEGEVVGVGGSYDFFKISYLNSIYFPVWRKGTLKLRGDFKYIVPFGKTKKNGVPYSERFFLGGETTVRGYKPFLLGPVVELLNDSNQLVPTQTPLGGLSSSLVSLEYNQEVFRMLDVFAFLDVGSVEFREFCISQVRPTTGVGLRLDIGNRTPIMVGYGIPLVKKDRNSEKWQKVFFSMGGQF
ncbi:MAG: outer membrane protein assembly factor BamA [Verrucomicrobia bacterium]|nr:outer membrane protein assembly factor BamA [Verrucomicrobiota bacterium]MDE3047308.1 outer membrane protein assembly factor BamA [Verrucomicrobiota bacterium]